MANLERLGARLRHARERAELTQDEVAEYLKVSRGQISYYENGRREIDLTSLMKLAALYGYSIHYFLDEPTTSSEVDEELLIAFRADGLDHGDLEAIAWIKRFARNLYELNNIGNEEG